MPKLYAQIYRFSYTPFVIALLIKPLVLGHDAIMQAGVEIDQLCWFHHPAQGTLLVFWSLMPPLASEASSTQKQVSIPVALSSSEEWLVSTIRTLWCFKKKLFWKLKIKLNLYLQVRNCYTASFGKSNQYIQFD